MEVGCFVHKTPATLAVSEVYKSAIKLDVKEFEKYRNDVWTRVNNVFVSDDPNFPGLERVEHKDEWLSEIYLLKGTKLSEEWIIGKETRLIYSAIYDLAIQTEKSEIESNKRTILLIHLQRKLDMNDELREAQLTPKNDNNAYAVELPAHMINNYVGTRPCEVILVHYSTSSKPIFVTWVNKRIGFGVHWIREFLNGKEASVDKMVNDAVSNVDVNKPSYVKGFVPKRIKKLDEGLLILDKAVEAIEDVEALLNRKGIADKKVVKWSEPVMLEGDVEDDDEEAIKSRTKRLKAVGRRFVDKLKPIKEEPDIIEIMDGDDVFSWK